MTAARYKAPSNFLALAGSRLGLDLLELFKENEKGQQGFEGLAPTFKTTATTKGRGGVLGYKAPKMPTTVSEFSLMPEPTAMSATTPAPAQAPTPTPMPTATKKSYDFFSRPNLGGPGFGARDIEAARSEGYSTEEIKNYLLQNQQFFGPGRLNLAAELQQELGLPVSMINPQVQADVEAGKYGTPIGLTPVPQTKFKNPLQTQEFVNAPSEPAQRTGISSKHGISKDYFGDEDLEAARESGYSDREIKEFLDKNISGLLRERNLPGKGGIYDQLRV